MYYQINITCPEEVQENLIAELLTIDFESFWQDDNSLSAYIEQTLFDEDSLKKILSRHLDSKSKNYEVSVLEEKNWNEEWEKNFDPVYINDQIVIRADFHKIDQKFRYEIVINPKMSFGTGHHETTCLMLKNQLTLDHKDKSVLDAGTGTGILSIMADKLGADRIVATDIDDWSIKNCQENFILNKCQSIEIKKGSIETLDLSGEFDVILANINRNILLHDIPYFARLLAPGGYLLLSGFYDSDIVTLTVVCEKNGLNSKNCLMKNNWASLTFRK